MSDIVYPYKPTIVIGKVNRSFSDCGITSDNVVRITKITTAGFQSFNPYDVANAITGFEKDAAYLVVSKKTIDLTGIAYNTVPDDFTIVPGTNVYANTWFAGIAIDTADFTTAGFTTTNLKVIICIDDPYMSYDPNDGANAITGFVAGQAYLGYALADMDISSYLIPPVVITSDIEQDVEPFKYWGTKDTTTKGYWPVTTRFVDAEIDRQEIAGILWIAESEQTASFWDGAAYQQIGGGGGITTETDPTVPTLVKNIPVSADLTTNKYLNWDGTAYIRKQINYSDLTGTPPGGSETDPLSVHLSGTSTATGDMTLDLGTTNEFYVTANQTNKSAYKVTNSHTTGGAAIEGVASGSGDALIGTSSSGKGVNGKSTSGIGTYGESTSSDGVQGRTSSGYGVTAYKFNAATNDKAGVLQILRFSSGTTTNGYGGYIDFVNEVSDGSGVNSGSIGSYWKDVTNTNPKGALINRVRWGSNFIVTSEETGAQVATTNATPTNLMTLPITDESCGILEIYIVARQNLTSGKVIGKKILSYTKDGGVLTLGSITSVMADEITGVLAGASYAITVVSNNLSIDVTGVASQNVTWITTVKIIPSV